VTWGAIARVASIWCKSLILPVPGFGKSMGFTEHRARFDPPDESLSRGISDPSRNITSASGKRTADCRY